MPTTVIPATPETPVQKAAEPTAGMMYFDVLDGRAPIAPELEAPVVDEALPDEAQPEVQEGEPEQLPAEGETQEGEPEEQEASEGEPEGDSTEAAAPVEQQAPVEDKVTLSKADHEAILTAKQERDNFQSMLENDAEFRTEYIKKIKRDGLKRDPNFRLRPELEAMIAPPPLPGPTRTDIVAQVETLESQGKFSEARDLWHNKVTLPEAEERARKILNEERAARNAEAQADAQKAERANQAKKYQAELTDCHKAFPSIVDKNGKIINKAVADKLATAEFIGSTEAVGALAAFPFKRVISLALHEMGMLGTSTTTAPRKTNAAASRVPGRGTVPPVKKAGVMTFQIVDRNQN